MDTRMSCYFLSRGFVNEALLRAFQLVECHRLIRLSLDDCLIFIFFVTPVVLSGAKCRLTCFTLNKSVLKERQKHHRTQMQSEAILNVFLVHCTVPASSRCKCCPSGNNGNSTSTECHEWQRNKKYIFKTICVFIHQLLNIGVWECNAACLRWLVAQV